MKRNTLITLFVLILGLIAYLAPRSKRLNDINTKYKHGALKSIYLTLESNKNNECLVTDRYATTLRRSDNEDDVRKSWCFFSEDKSVLIQRRKKKSVLLIPEINFSAKDMAEVKSLKLEWIVLYKDRLEDGIYLKVSFPEDSWKEHKKQKKQRRIIGLYTKNKIYALDTLLRPAPRYEASKEAISSELVVMKIDGQEDVYLPNIIIKELEKINFKDYILKNFYQGPIE